MKRWKEHFQEVPNRPMSGIYRSIKLAENDEALSTVVEYLRMKLKMQFNVVLQLILYFEAL